MSGKGCSLSPTALSDDTGRRATIAAALLVLAFLLPSFAAPIPVTTFEDEVRNDGDCSLREAVLAANRNAAVDACPAGSAAEVDVVVLGEGSYAIALGSSGENSALEGDFDVQDALRVEGVSAEATILDGAGIDRLFDLWEVGLELDALTLQGGAGDSKGGAILVRRGALVLSDVVIRDSQSGRGGAVAFSTRSDASLSVRDSAFVGNRALANHGGAIDVQPSASTTVEATLTNVTMSGNRADNGSGGALYLSPDAGAGATVMLTNVTVAENAASSGGSLARTGGVLRLANTILSAASGGECSGAVVSLGHNLASDRSCGLAGSADLSGVAAGLLPLAANAAATPTHALGGDSPAIDGGDDARCPGEDQGGVARPLDGDGDGEERCDVGAYELSALVRVEVGPSPPPASLTTESDAGEVPVLQLLLQAGSAEGVSVESATLSSRGSGDDRGGIGAVSVYLDADGDGELDAGETLLAQGRFERDNGSLTVVFDAPLDLAAGADATLLVVYRLGSSAAAVLLGLAALVPLGLARRTRRRWRLVLLCLTLLGLAACTPGSTTFQPSLDAVAASGQATGRPAAVSGAPLDGTQLIVAR